MRVRKYDCAENVAFGKTAWQSSTFGTFVASNAVDGINSAPGASTKQGRPIHKWGVNFGGLKVIDDIELRIRMWITGGVYSVNFSNTSDFQKSQHCQTFRRVVSENGPYKVSFKCLIGKVVAKFMKIQFINPKGKALGLLEVVVFGWNV